MRVTTSSPRRAPLATASRAGTIFVNAPLGTVVKPFTCRTDWKTR